MNIKSIDKAKFVRVGIFLLGAILLYLAPSKKLHIVDDRAQEYFSQSIERAGIAYASSRGLNALVSIVKETTVQLEPAGVGLSLAIGQALDPIDDMTERLSDVLVMAIVSLGLQKLIYELGVSIIPNVLCACFLFLSVMSLFSQGSVASITRGSFNICMILVVGRFFLPLSAFLNEWMFDCYFQQYFTQSTDVLSMATGKFDHLKHFELPEIDGISGTIKNSAEMLKLKVTQLQEALSGMTENLGNVIDHLLRLTWMYLAVFIIQVIVLPLGMFWLLLRLLSHLFSIDVSTKLLFGKRSVTNESKV